MTTRWILFIVLLVAVGAAVAWQRKKPAPSSNRSGPARRKIEAQLGGIPLALGHGDGSELRQPLGYAVVGGLIVSQALTLFTTPVVYLCFDRLTQRLRRRRATEAAAVLKPRPT